MVEIIDNIEMVENVEIANSHAVFLHIAENKAGSQKSLGEYPTLSAIYLLKFASHDFYAMARFARQPRFFRTSHTAPKILDYRHCIADKPFGSRPGRLNAFIL